MSDFSQCVKAFKLELSRKKELLKIIDHFSILHYWRNDDVREAGEIPDTTICKFYRSDTVFENRRKSRIIFIFTINAEY